MEALDQSIVSRGRIFERWKVLGAAVTGMSLGFPILLSGSFGLFILPLSETFGWQRGDISVAVAIPTYAVLAPLVGFLIDKYSVRQVLLPSIVFSGLSFGSMFFLTGSIWHLYIMYWLILPVLGIGTNPVSYTRVVLNWFDQRKGLALGICNSGIGIGQAIIPVCVQLVIGAFGWRWAYAGLGAISLFVCFPVVALFLHEAPQGAGSVSHARKQRDLKTPVTSGDVIGLTLPEALRTRSFYTLIAVFLALGIFTAGSVAHMVPLLVDRGMDPVRAAMVLSVLGITIFVGRIAGGYLLDRIFAVYVAACFLSGSAIGVTLLALGATGDLAFVSAILLGLGFGVESDLLAYLITRYLGLRAYGKIFGYVYMAFGFGASIGPMVAGYSFQFTGSYTIALWILCSLVLTALALLFSLGAYPKLQVGGQGGEVS